MKYCDHENLCDYGMSKKHEFSALNVSLEFMRAACLPIGYPYTSEDEYLCAQIAMQTG